MKIKEKMVFAKEITRLNFQYLASFSLIALVITIFYLKSGNDLDKSTTRNEEQTIFMQNNVSNTQKSCNLFSGKWVYDDKSNPPYNESQCLFMSDEYACEKYGRKDLKYQNWRWQPHDCDLPRFNGTALLEKIRGKKLVFVGDSLNRNQWTSMLCLIESSIPPSSSKSIIRDGNLIFFQASMKEYNATIGFYWSPFLVESNNDDLVAHGLHESVVRIDSIEKHAFHWTDADILIFDSFAWWIQSKITLLWGSFGSPDAINKTGEMSKLGGYEMALDTWSNWLEIHINRTRTNLFFMSFSPTHNRWGEYWSLNRQCYNETEPFMREGNLAVGAYHKIMEAAESALQKLESRGLKVQFLNITQLSDYRKDAHPSVYRKFYHPPTQDQLKDPNSYSDCLHWCLPGLPDIWNQILYFYLMN